MIQKAKFYSLLCFKMPELIEILTNVSKEEHERLWIFLKFQISFAVAASIDFQVNLSETIWDLLADESVKIKPMVLMIVKPEQFQINFEGIDEELIYWYGKFRDERNNAVTGIFLIGQHAACTLN